MCSIGIFLLIIISEPSRAILSGCFLCASVSMHLKAASTQLLPLLRMDPITSALTFFSTKIWDPIAFKVACIVDAGDTVRSMILSMAQLKDKSRDVRNRVSAAEAQLQTPTHEVDGWLRRVRELETEVTAIERDFLGQVRCLCSCPANPSSSYRIGTEATRKISEVNELLGRANFNVVATKSNAEVAVELPTTSAVGIGSLMENVLRFLSDDENVIVVIHGMGGVGKTTLLKSINNIFVDKRSEFDLVIMVEAFPEFKIEHMQQAIAGRIGLPLSEDARIEDRAIDILKCLRGRKFLLLLDNLWGPINLIQAGIPIEQSKCKVVIASRSESICGEMRAKKIKVEFLPPEKAWELFRQKLGDLVKDPEIEYLAKMVAEYCNGLPLALVVVAATMSAKTTRQEWSYAVRLMKKMQLDSLIAENLSIIQILKLSYDSLSSDQLKLCFLSGSFYPRGHSILKEELIECWMGLGFLEEHNDINEDYERGHFLIGKLREASLLEPGDDEQHVKMHDIIRGLALNLTSTGLSPQTEKDTSQASGNQERFWVVQPGIYPLSNFPDEFLDGSPVERMSLMHNIIETLPDKTDFPILLSLMLQSNVSLTGVVSQGFFSGMRCLKYLDLSSTSVQEVCGIEQLSLLEHLNLSCTRIQELPEGLRSLKRLKYFYLMQTHNLHLILHKLVSSLQSLRVFNIYGSSYQFWTTDDDDGGYRDINGVSLREFDQLTNLKALGISIRTHSAFQNIFYMSIPTRYLYISDLNSRTICESNAIDHFNLLQFPSTVRLRSKIDTSLLEITIKSCKDLEELMIGEEIKQDELENIHKSGHRLCSLKGLENLYLSRLRKLSKVTWRGVKPSEYFPNLRFLSIHACPELGSITWVLQLPCLEKLHISDCSRVQQVIAKDEGSLIIERRGPPFFPRVKEINLVNLPELTSIYQHTLAFPYLVSLHVSRCPKLVSLPFGERSGYHLQEIRGSKDWWNNLKWADNNLKVSFFRHFKEAAS